MKYSILILLTFAYFCSDAQSKKRKIILSKESLSKKEIQAVNPKLLDTILQVTPNGDVLMKIEIAKNLETIHVTDEATGEVTKKMVRPIKNVPSAPIPNRTAVSDTILIENPLTGEMQKVIARPTTR